MRCGQSRKMKMVAMTRMPTTNAEMKRISDSGVNESERIGNGGISYGPVRLSVRGACLATLACAASWRRLQAVLAPTPRHPLPDLRRHFELVGIFANGNARGGLGRPLARRIEADLAA